MSAAPHQFAAPGLRSDARDNRERILSAARSAFAEHGLQVPMREVARRAGVGIATLYRRFPTARDLVTAVFEDRFAICMREIDVALSDPRPWAGFARFIQTVCDLQVADRGFTEAFYASHPDTGTIQTQRDDVLARFADLAARAQRAGELRPDFVPGDLSVILLANSGLRGPSTAATLAGSRRLVAYLLESLRAPARGALPPPVDLPIAQLGGRS
ncbi:MAG: Transcriptional regulator, TetR family [Pseudonocardiales bacterium]|nr:Transcriptional regulator, TetR family [Pseudonocardiales bacterium]